jgi:hypothetical protein
MRPGHILCIVICVGLPTTAALARGGMGAGMGSHSMSTIGGAFRTSAARPGTALWELRFLPTWAAIP